MSWGMFGVAMLVLLLMMASGRRRAVVVWGALVIAVDLFPWLLGLAVHVALTGAVALAVGVVAWRKRGRVSAWLAARQQRLSDRLHAADEKAAAERGWMATRSTGRFGFGARTYRDPRFDRQPAKARVRV